MCHPEVSSEPCQTSNIERFVKIVNNFSLLNIFTKSFDIWKGCEYPYVVNNINSVFAY